MIIKRTDKIIISTAKINMSTDEIFINPNKNICKLDYNYYYK